MSKRKSYSGPGQAGAQTSAAEASPKGGAQTAQSTGNEVAAASEQATATPAPKPQEPPKEPQLEPSGADRIKELDKQIAAADGSIKELQAKRDGLRKQRDAIVEQRSKRGSMTLSQRLKLARQSDLKARRQKRQLARQSVVATRDPVERAMLSSGHGQKRPEYPYKGQ